MSWSRYLLPLLLLPAWLAWPPTPAHAELMKYVARKEPAYAWKAKNKTTFGKTTIYSLELVSQTWRDITWKHDILVFVPEKVKSGSGMVLMNVGGSANL